MKLSDIEDRHSFEGILFSQPTHFDIEYEINPYMDSRTEVGDFRSNWVETVRESRKGSKNVQTVDYDTYSVLSKPTDELPDLVFSANHAMPEPDTNGFILSNMKMEERVEEVEYFAEWAQSFGYNIRSVPSEFDFEGSGDAKWHPNKNLVWIGYGQRTDRMAVEEIDDIIDAEVVPIELKSGRFYHLDVCFTALSEESVIVIPDGITDESYNRIEEVFETVLHVPEDDIDTMGGNSARLPNGDIIIDEKNSRTVELLEDNGFRVRTVDTEEFRKSGGSVDCLFLRTP